MLLFIRGWERVMDGFIDELRRKGGGSVFVLSLSLCLSFNPCLDMFFSSLIVTA